MKYITYLLLSCVSAVLGGAIMSLWGMFVSFSVWGIVTYLLTSVVVNFMQWLLIDFLSKKVKDHG